MMMKKKLLILIGVLGFSLSHAQDIGFGQTSPKANLDINGGVTIGTSTSYTGSATSANGAIIQGTVGIGNNNPSAKAILDLTNGSNKGVLLPRITSSAEAGLTGVSSGLMFYNTTTNCVDVYANGSWQSVYCPCPTLSSPVVSGPTSVCANSTGNVYTVAAVAGVTTYTWSASGTASNSNIITTSGNSATVTAPSSGTYNVTCTISNACGAKAVGSTSTMISSSSIAWVANPTSVTEGTNVTYTVTSGQTTYTWDPTPTGWTVASGGGNTNTITYTLPANNTSTSINYAGTMSVGCSVIGPCGSAHPTCSPYVHGSYTWSYTGANQSTTVPTTGGVTSLTVTAAGGQAGNVFDGGWGGQLYNSAAGPGEEVVAGLTVTSGEVIYIQIGQAGGSATNGTTAGTGGIGGYVTGSTGDESGGNGGANSSSVSAGSGGGGATDIRVGGTALTNRVIVAGGGGGNGNDYSDYYNNYYFYNYYYNLGGPYNSCTYGAIGNFGGAGGSLTATGTAAGGNAQQTVPANTAGLGGNGPSSPGGAVSGSGSAEYAYSCYSGTITASSCGTGIVGSVAAVTNTGSAGGIGIYSSSSSSCSGVHYFGGGGGGGGYGGGSGGVANGGGGGGSYLGTGTTFISSSTNGTTPTPANGYVTIAW